MTKLFKIGDFCFSVTYPEELSPPENFMLFEVAEGTPEYSYGIKTVSELPAPQGELIARREDIVVCGKNGLEERLMGIKGRKGYYAYYEEVSPEEAHIYLDTSCLGELNIDPVFTSLLALERRLAGRGGLILHCAYIKHRGEAILFSAPSETGKTTQANLWEKYRGSKTVNGDRALLQCIDGRWTAQGWPVCGTSEICNNTSLPIKAIVMLSQGKDNRARRLSAMEAFPQLYSQITVNSWNRGLVQQSMDLIGGLISEVPVYHLSCTISQEAVDCLDKIVYN